MIEAGDEVEIKKGGKVYRGIVMPHHIFSDKNILVIKLPSGYNMGVDVRKCEVKILRKGKRMERKMPSITHDRNKPTIALIGTGGTIASYVDYETGAVHPTATAEELAFAAPEVFQLCNVEADVLSQKLSENITPQDWQRMAKRAGKYLKNGKPVVIAHGTDTMAYSSAALSFMLQNLPAPVVFVGSQRSSDRPSSDAFFNLMASVRVALTDIGEVVVVMHSSISSKSAFIHRGTKVRKMHSSRRDAFLSVNARPIGKVEGDKIIFTGEYNKRKRSGLVIKTALEKEVALVYYHPGMKKEDFEKMVEGKKGVVIAGTGLGHVGNHLIPSIKKLAKNGVPVVMTTQCLWGRVNMNVYSTGRKLMKAGVISGHDMLPEVAWIKLMWVLANDDDVENAMMKNIAGEISERHDIDAKKFIFTDV